VASTAEPATTQEGANAVTGSTWVSARGDALATQANGMAMASAPAGIATSTDFAAANGQGVTK
jgi:hypothetical protein